MTEVPDIYVVQVHLSAYQETVAFMTGYVSVTGHPGYARDRTPIGGLK